MSVLRVFGWDLTRIRPHDETLIGPIPARLGIRVMGCCLTTDGPVASLHRYFLFAEKGNDVFPYDTPTGEPLGLVKPMEVATDPDVTGRNDSCRIYHL